jgi:hypothetical protein
MLNIEPIGCGEIRGVGERTLCQKSDIDYCIYEFPPQIRTVRIIDCANKMFHLSFPFTVFVTMKIKHYVWNKLHGMYSHLFAFWSKTSLGLGTDSIDSLLYIPLLPNIGDTGLVCLGSNVPPYDTPSLELIRRFWQTPFYSEDRICWPGFNALQSTDFRSYANWERITREDPSRIMQFEFPCGCYLTRGIMSVYALLPGGYSWIHKTSQGTLVIYDGVNHGGAIWDTK